VSKLPLILIRAIYALATPLYVVNPPQMIILPSDCNSISNTLPIGPAHISNVVSSVPSVFKRAKSLLATPLYVVKLPQIITFPSDCIAVENMEALAPAPVANVISNVPLLFKRATPPLAVPSYNVKLPQIIILPSGCNVIDQIELFAPAHGLNIVSNVPSVLRRAILFLGVPLYVVKSPQMMSFPSVCSAILLILEFAPIPVA